MNRCDNCGRLGVKFNVYLGKNECEHCGHHGIAQEEPEQMERMDDGEETSDE